MIRFNNDYSEGAHPQILQALIDTNMVQTGGYGEDSYCDRAKALILQALGAAEGTSASAATLREAAAKSQPGTLTPPEAARKLAAAASPTSPAIHFLVGGTQTNLTVIAACLRPHQGVLCAPTGHINVHETGAVEATGHKVLPLPGIAEETLPYKNYGKISAEQIEKAVKDHFENGAFEHMVQPGMVYISHPTEYGTLYTLSELEDISAVCHKYGLPLFVDGARLAYGLAAGETTNAKTAENDQSDGAVTLPDLCRLADVFYIGGTKVGMLFGEAVVITNPAIAKDFRYLMKQRGGMLAKGRLLGVQFGAAFEPSIRVDSATDANPASSVTSAYDCLYYQMGRHATSLAQHLKRSLMEAGCRLFIDSPTNQQFVILPDEVLPKLSEDFAFEPFDRYDETHSVIRFCISWATREEDVELLIRRIKELI